MELPSKFLNEIRRTGSAMDGRQRHLCLLNNEGLHIIERWRTMRAFMNDHHSQQTKSI